MNRKQISIILMGVTVFYAGVLSLADDLYVGVGMMIGGSILTLIPLWKVFGHSWSLSSRSTGHSVKTRKKKKTHLKVVKPDEESVRPTIDEIAI
jgi:hypothetical protein